MTNNKDAYANDKAMSRLGKVTEMDRSFDIEYWQSQPPAARFAAIWEITLFHHTLRKGDPDELRLDRSAEQLKRRGC